MNVEGNISCEVELGCADLLVKNICLYFRVVSVGEEGLTWPHSLYEPVLIFIIIVSALLYVMLGFKYIYFFRGVIVGIVKDVMERINKKRFNSKMTLPV